MKSFIVFLVTLMSLFSDYAFDKQVTSDCEKKILGNWQSLKDSISFIKFEQSHLYIDSVSNTTIDSTQFFFLNSDCDTLCVMMDQDTLVYSVSYLDDSNLDIVYLGVGIKKEYSSTNILSYRRVN